MKKCGKIKTIIEKQFNSTIQKLVYYSKTIQKLGNCSKTIKLIANYSIRVLCIVLSYFSQCWSMHATPNGGKRSRTI